MKGNGPSAEQPTDLVLHLVWHPDDTDIAFVVSSATLAEAEVAEEPNPYDGLSDFGDLRRSGDLGELERQLFDVDLEDYVASIERSAGRQPGPGDLAARLQALNDVQYDGETVEPEDADIYIPGDRHELNHDGEDADAEPYWRVIYNAMRSDIPADLREAHCREREGGSMVWWGRLDTSIIPGHLDTLIAELESRGYTILRGQPGAQ